MKWLSGVIYEGKWLERDKVFLLTKPTEDMQVASRQYQETGVAMKGIQVGKI